MTENSGQHPADEPEISQETASEASCSWDEMETGFSGNPRTKMDERGRLKMPAEFKAFLDKKYGKGFNRFYITSRDGFDALIFPAPEWKAHQDRIFEMPPSSEARQDLLRRYNLWGGRVDMDPQGRLLLPEELRNEGVLVGDVKVSGEGTFLRVTSLARLRETVKPGPIAPQHADELGRAGV